MKKVELLAPAGGKEQFIAAVENGADAVYLGGTLYNARMNAANFTLDELREVLDYGHLRGVKTYVTMNTLLRNDELSEAVEYAGKLYRLGVDALIIQDLGLGMMIKTAYPELPLHLSTQGTVYSPEGVKAVTGLGYSRVVTARELSLEGIRACADCGTEIEVFVHGALCFCYSGQCQLSRFIGGRSGNRGACAQPCRLAYAGGEGEYPLSPKDLCMIDRLGDLIEAGAASLKIEGRMKSPEYVATVTRIYRKYIDEYYEHGPCRVSPEDMEDLTQIFNRGSFTRGYADHDPGKDLMSGRLSKNQGVLMGRIVRTVKNGLLAEAELFKAPAMGDVMEVHGRERTAFTLTYLEELGDGRYTVGDLKGSAAYGDEVYRLISKDLTDRARASFQDVISSGRYNKRTRVDMTFTAQAGGGMRLSAAGSFAGKRVSAVQELPGFTVSEAKNRATSEEEIRAQLIKTGGTPFEAGNVKIMAEGVFIPLSKLNQLRRACLEALSIKAAEAFRRQGGPAGEFVYGLTPGIPEDVCEICFDSAADFAGRGGELAARLRSQGVKAAFLLPITEIEDNLALITDRAQVYNSVVIPYLPNVTGEAGDRWLREHMTGLLQATKALGGYVYAGNISQIEGLKQAGLKVLGDCGLNIFNDACAAVYESLGVSAVVPAWETMDRMSGAFPLMTGEHQMKEGILTDRKGQKYRVTFDNKMHKSVIRAMNVCPDLREAGGRRIYTEVE